MKITEQYSFNQILNSIFKALELENQIPKVLMAKIEFWTEVEFKLIKHILNGKSVRKFPELRLSKKEAHIFITSEHYNIFQHQNTDILQNYISFCKIIKSNSKSIKFMQGFFYNLSLFTPYDVDKNISKHYKFWNSIYNTLSKWSFKDTHAELSEIIDYINHQKTYGHNFSLKGRNIDSLSRTVIRWHRDLYLTEHIDYTDKKWAGSKMDDLKIEHKSKTYYINQIKTGERLYEEGDNLEHCVITYLHEVMRGASSIWNLHTENDDTKNDLTIEIKGKHILQASGFRNRAPKKLELEVLNIWLQIDEELPF